MYSPLILFFSPITELLLTHNFINGNIYIPDGFFYSKSTSIVICVLSSLNLNLVSRSQPLPPSGRKCLVDCAYSVRSEN